LAKDTTVKQWVAAVKEKLLLIGITTVRELYKNLDSVNVKLEEYGHSAFKQETLKLMKECCETTAKNTGHIVFASGRAIHKGNNEYRIRVVHSTKHGKLDENGQVTTGVQEYFRRFTRKEDGTWTRPTTKGENPLLQSVSSIVGAVVTDDEDEDDNPNDDMEEDEDTDMVANECEQTAGEVAGESEEEVEAGGDELAGQIVEVIAARMCF
jgi:hypothetical protein